MIYYINAIQSLVPNAQCVVNNNSYENIIWHDERALPSKETVDTEFAKLQAEETSKQEEQSSVKASALAKLAALGLTQDEVKSLLG